MTDRGPGRPTPENVIVREQRITGLLDAHPALTRNEIATMLRERPRLVYLALLRLRERGVVEKDAGPGRRNHWYLVR